MITVYNDNIPLDGYIAITVWPFVFVRNSCRKKFDSVTKNHERIHGRQQVEFPQPLFFTCYTIEWIVRLVIYRNLDEAYYNISFEQEAYENEKNMNYVPGRKHFAWLKYLFRKTYTHKQRSRSRVFDDDNF